MFMYGYVYKTTDLTNNKIYIGQHRAISFNPNYLGSGIAIKDAVAVKGKHNFKVEIIESYDTQSELDAGEIYYIYKLNSQDRDIGYNIADGGGGAILRGADNGMYGRTHTKESKLKMSKTILERGNHSGKNNGFYGRSHTEETKQVLRDKCRQDDEFYQRQSELFTHDFDVERAYKLLQEGNTYKQISEIMGISKTTVFRKLKNYTAHHSNG